MSQCDSHGHARRHFFWLAFPNSLSLIVPSIICLGALGGCGAKPPADSNAPPTTTTISKGRQQNTGSQQQEQSAGTRDGSSTTSSGESDDDNEGGSTTSSGGSATSSGGNNHRICGNTDWSTVDTETLSCNQALTMIYDTAFLQLCATDVEVAGCSTDADCGHISAMMKDHLCGISVNKTVGIPANAAIAADSTSLYNQARSRHNTLVQQGQCPIPGCTMPAPRCDLNTNRCVRQ